MGDPQTNPNSFSGLRLSQRIDREPERSLQEQIILEVSKELEEADIPTYVEGPPEPTEEWANLHAQTAGQRSVTLTLYKDQFIVRTFEMSLRRRLKEIEESRITSDAYGHSLDEFRKELADPDSLEWAANAVARVVLENDGRIVPVVAILEMIDRHRMLGPSRVAFGKPYYAYRWMTLSKRL